MYFFKKFTIVPLEYFINILWMLQDLNGDFFLLGSILSCFYLESNENYVIQHSPLHQFVFVFSFQFYDLTSIRSIQKKISQ
jgi:hypothetical protein